jgi:hypothetical protein
MRIKVKEYYQRLEQAVSDILINADVKEYLKKMALFRSYSFGNTLFILAQRPSARRLAGLLSYKSDNNPATRVAEGFCTRMNTVLPKL